METLPKHIVLLGGGYVSVWAYRSLVSRLGSQIDRGEVKITVVCPHKHHFFHGWTAESLTGIIQNQNRLSPLADILPKAHLILGSAEEIDSVAQRVYVRTQSNDRQVITYDHLLLGIGSVDSEVIAGIQTYGYQVKSAEGFRRTQQTIQRLIEQAAYTDADTARQLLHFTIAGGGFAGVEIATNLAEFIDLAKRHYPGLKNIDPKIRLINSGAQILTVLQPDFKRLIRYAEKTMRQYGIEVINNTRISSVTEQGAWLSDGSLLESSMVISTIGQRQIILKGTEHMDRDGSQRLYTNAYQQLNGHPAIWGGGDSCHVAHCQTGEPCPANALWAIKHGEYVGRNIARAVKEQSLKPFTYRGLGQAASLGLGKGISELYGVQITGPISWIMRWFFFHYFMPSRKQMLNTVGDWLFLLFRRQRKGLWTEERSPQPEQFVVNPAT